jgi:hypothetical protein
MPCDILHYTPPSTSDLRAMRSAREDLRSRIDAHVSRTGCPARVLFDLRSCRIGTPQLEFTLRTLHKNEAYMHSHLHRSAALIPAHRPAVKALADLFLRVYTPVRPFCVEVDEEAARAFLEAG